jgi:hypothetical protein
MIVDAANSLLYVHENSIFFFFLFFFSLRFFSLPSYFAIFMSTETRDRPSESQQMVLDVRREKNKKIIGDVNVEQEREREFPCTPRRRRVSISMRI